MYDGFSETWAKICGFTCSGGWKLETNGGFIETGGFGDVKGRRPLTSPKSPSFNEYHHWFSSFHTPRTREYRKVLPKLHWIPSYKNKINMSVFPLKPSFSHFSISFLLWIPSLSLSDQESRDTLPTSPYLLVLWQFSRMYSGNIDCPSRSKLLTFTYGLYICSKSGRIVSRIWKTLRPWKKASILVWFWRTTILLRKHQNC